MDEFVVQQPDDEAGFSSHRGMHGAAGEQITREPRPRHLPAPNDVARVKVAHQDREVLALKIGFDLFAQVESDIPQLHIPGGVTLPGIGLQQILASAFGDHNDRMLALDHALLQHRE